MSLVDNTYANRGAIITASGLTVGTMIDRGCAGVTRLTSANYINATRQYTELHKVGTSAQRPIAVPDLFIYKDNTLGKAIMRFGESWVNLDGSALS